MFKHGEEFADLFFLHGMFSMVVLNFRLFEAELQPLRLQAELGDEKK